MAASSLCEVYLPKPSAQVWQVAAVIDSAQLFRRTKGRQIDERGYAKPFATDGRKIVKVGIKFSPETMTVEDWRIAD